jgi:predicted TPR repeat methyltransferase
MDQFSGLKELPAGINEPGGLRVTFPEVPPGQVDQDEEFCWVDFGGERRRIRFHDYHEIYAVPGLYEYIFYDKLGCQSPSLLGTLLAYEVEREGLRMEALNVLDVGAGNGIMGEVLADAGVESMVGVDILPEAAEAARRDRPGLYRVYHRVDLLDPPAGTARALEETTFNCLTLVAALGFGDIPPAVFATAFNFIVDGGFVAFNLKEDFLSSRYTTGFAALLRRMEAEGWLDVRMRVRYVHRYSIAGDPLHYVGIVGRKRCDLPARELQGEPSG